MKKSLIITFLIVRILIAEQHVFPSPPDSFHIAEGTRFMVLGDWGRKGSADQSSVAMAMAEIANQYPIEFIISTGDNFYNRGVKNTYDPHWQKSFEHVYRDSALLVPWYVVLGNHDHYGNVDAQIAYHHINARWVFPAPYYVKELATEFARIVLIFTDTQPLAKNMETDMEQYLWIENTLQNSDADWKFVVGHHPVRTGGKHGEYKAIIENFKPILEKYNVDVYFAGHDHDLQFLQEGNIYHVISGGGSKIRSVKNTPFTLFSAASLGFVLCSVKQNELFIYYFNEYAQLLYQTVIRK